MSLFLSDIPIILLTKGLTLIENKFATLAEKLKIILEKSGIKKISSFDTENFQTKIAAEITDFSPDEILGRKFASRLDRFAQFACVTAKEAIKDSGIYLDAVDLERFAVLIGSGIGGIKTLSDQFNVLSEKGPSRISPFLVPMMLSDMASGQVSMMLGTKGPNFSTVSACASAADSIGQGLHMIRSCLLYTSPSPRDS